MDFSNRAPDLQGVEDDGVGTTKHDALGGDLMCTLMAAVHFPVSLKKKKWFLPICCSLQLRHLRSCKESGSDPSVLIKLCGGCMHGIAHAGLCAVAQRMPCFTHAPQLPLLCPACNMLSSQHRVCVWAHNQRKVPHSHCCIAMSTKMCRTLLPQLPFEAPRALGLHGHAFVNGGSVELLTGTDRTLRQGARDFLQSFRWSAVRPEVPLELGWRFSGRCC